MSRVYEITADAMQEMVQIIVDEIHPVRIILFGSRAKSDFRPDSDIDLLIIEKEPFGKNRSRRKEAARLWRVLARFRIPKDILLFTQSEVEAWHDSANHVIAKAAKEGTVLYETQYKQTKEDTEKLK